MRVLTALLGICLTVATIRGQRPEFDVATVKLPAAVPLGTPIGINLGTFRKLASTS